jgi:hypothetical protein
MNETAVAEKRNAPTNTDEAIIERGLMAMAAYNGNSRKAAAFLEQDGIQVNQTTLWAWARRKHVGRYEELRAEVLPKIRAEAADEHMELARLNMELERSTLEQLKDKIPEMPARDLPGASRNLAVSSAVHTERSEGLNDRPTERIAIDLAGTLKEIRSMGVDPEVVLDAQVVSEEDVVEVAQSTDSDH